MTGTMKYESPSASKSSFNCPPLSCLVYAILVLRTDNSTVWVRKTNLPPIAQQDDLRDALKEPKRPNKDEDTKRLRKIDLLKRSLAGGPFLWNPGFRPNSDCVLGNVFVSECYDCKLLSIWIHDSLYYPSRGEMPPANPDIPEEIRKDYDEASRILNDSPRGAAALLRLVVQKLCKELGGKGTNINVDIAHLVKNGLHPKIQKALDSVRIIGNEAVHPGQMDLRDDRETAELLFDLINTIADNMISSEKRIDEVWGKIPKNKKLETKNRDSTSP